MSHDRFQKGVENILAMLQTTLVDRGVQDPVVTHSVKPGEASTATVSVTAYGQEETQEFGYEEILDSGDAVDAPVALKLRMLVSHFIR